MKKKRDSKNIQVIMTTASYAISLDSITEKVYQGERLNAEEGLYLLKCQDQEEIERIRQLADFSRKKRAGDTVYFASTLHINPTNLCELNCPFCSFYAKPGWAKAWFLTPEQIEEKVRSHLHQGLTEIHVVGGLWRDCNLDYYKDAFGRIKKIDQNLHIKALTAVEYDFLAKLHGISIEEVLKRMVDYGLGALPGGGAEVLVERIRKKIAPGKITSEEFLHIHQIAHNMGLKSNITMLFGHIEEPEDLITHMCWVREIQDKTMGFRAFIPLKFAEENNALGKRKNQLKSKNVRLVYAVSRLMMDNFPHLKVLWNYVGVDLGVELLNWGGNDLSSTNLDEKIITMAGGIQVKMNKETMSSLIKGIGRTPQLTHTGLI